MVFGREDLGWHRFRLGDHVRLQGLLNGPDHTRLLHHGLILVPLKLGRGDIVKITSRLSFVCRVAGDIILCRNDVSFLCTVVLGGIFFVQRCILLGVRITVDTVDTLT